MTYGFEQNRINGGIAADDEYWKGLEDGQFKLPQCALCNAWTWPAHFRCCECGSWEFKWTVLEPAGNVFSWTRTWYAFEGVGERRGDVPYVTILAEIPKANGARVLGVLLGGEENLRIGAPVKGVIEPPSPKTKGYAAIRWSLTV